MADNDNPTEDVVWTEDRKVPPELESWLEDLCLRLIDYMHSHPEEQEEE